MTVFGILIAIVFEPLRSVIQKFVDKRFFKTHYDYREAIKEFSRMVVMILDLDQLLQKTAETIRQTLQLDQVVVFLKNADTNVFEVAAFTGGDESIIANWSFKEESGLVQRLAAAKQSVILDRDQGVAQAVMSLTIDNKIRGFLVLGEKLSGDVYTPNDIDLLSTLADQLSIAVENARLYRAAVTDKVSRLFSGTYFYDRLEEELARSKEHKTSLGVLMLDIDGFTLINDREGSAVADYIISAIGAEIENEIRPYDIAARVGDDEFAIMLPGVQRDEIHFWESKMQASVARLRINGETGLVTVSAGSAFTENGLKPSRRLLNEAKRDLIQTKSRRNASGLYS
ncbi:MAG: diguanylate cyclase [Actinomycetota bacterium]